MWWTLALLPAAFLALLHCAGNVERRPIRVKARPTVEEKSKDTTRRSRKREVEVEAVARRKKKSSSSRADAAIRADQKAAEMAMAMVSPITSTAREEEVKIRPEPAQVIWPARGGYQWFNLVNDGSEPMAFKVKCSDNGLYRVKPVWGLLLPAESVKIEILRQKGSVKLDKLVVFTAKMTTDDVKRSIEVAEPGLTALTIVPQLVEV